MPTIRIDDEVWNYLKTKATPFEDTPNDVLRRELKISPSSKQTATATTVTTAGTRSPLMPDRDYSHHAIKGFVLTAFDKGAKPVSCRSFSEMLKIISSMLLLKHMDAFAKIALELRGKKRPYFSKNLDELRKPYKIEPSNIFVETNLSANSIVAISRLLLRKLGHDPNSLTVE